MEPQIFNLEDIEEDFDTDFNYPLCDLFFADGDIEEEDGLVWKDVLREGTWAYRPGNSGKPLPIPLKIVAGRAGDGEIGMADLMDAFKEGAVDHVTVPTTHEDRPQDNTGYVKDLRVEERNGIHYLKAGIKFTEPEIEGKAIRGSIANTSSGIMFNYVKKDTGKTYKNVLGHVALTNKPWINGMQPFGVGASEGFSEDEHATLMFESVIWDTDKALTSLRDKVSQAINKGVKDGSNYFYVHDVQTNKALVCNAQGDQFWVVPFQVRSGDMKIPDQSKWIEASREWVKASEDALANLKVFDSSRLSEEAPETGAGNSPQKEELMGKEDNTEVTSGAPSDPAPVTLSEDARTAIIEEARADFEDRITKQAEENDALREKVHVMEVEKKIALFSDAGLKSEPGLLAEIRDLMLADKGQPALNLSETVEGVEKETSLTVTEALERVINKFPKKDGKIALSEQILEVEDHGKPNEEVELSEDEKGDALIDELGIDLPKKTEKRVETKKDGDE